MSQLNRFIFSIKREMWEHKNTLVRNTSIITLLIFICILIELGLQAFGTNFTNGAGEFLFNQNNISIDLNFTEVESDREFFKPSESHLLVGYFLLYAYITFAIINYLASALLNDRKDRSILFWKSLPITETQNVLTKLFVATFIIPAFFCVAAVAITVFYHVMSFFYLMLFSDESVLYLWHIDTPFTTLLKIITLTYIQTLWCIPVCAWLLLASAYSKRSPLLVAVIPIIILSILETVFSNTSLLSSLWFKNISNILYPITELNTISIGHEIASLIMNADMYIGIVCSAVFITGAVWLRNHRYE